MRNIFILAGCVLKELIRRKDLYLIFALLLVILFYSGSLSFGGESNFQRYFKEIGISFTYIFSIIIAATFASRQIPQETETKSAYHILARPVSRGEFIMGKFFGVFFVAAVSFSAFYTVYIISLVLHRDFSTPPILFIEGYILHMCLLSFFTALTILFSLFLSAASNAIVILILYFGTNWFGAVFPAYIYLPHPELFDMRDKIIHSWDTVPANVMLFLTLYALAYTILFLFTSYTVFRKRNL
jgi:Cu-processing system permease protein